VNLTEEPLIGAERQLCPTKITIVSICRGDSRLMVPRRAGGFLSAWRGFFFPLMPWGHVLRPRNRRTHRLGKYLAVSHAEWHLSGKGLT